MYKVFINNKSFIENSHKAISDRINKEIIEGKLQSNLTSRHIVSNWLSRNNKSKKWDFVAVLRTVSKKPVSPRRQPKVNLGVIQH
jgi:hypothetical protein